MLALDIVDNGELGIQKSCGSCSRTITYTRFKADAFPHAVPRTVGTKSAVTNVAEINQSLPFVTNICGVILRNAVKHRVELRGPL